MTSTRLDLRHLRLLVAVVAVLLAVVAAGPQGASAKPSMSQAKASCEAAGGTWTVEGSTAYCKGIGNGGDYSCNLKIGPDACSHLPRFSAAFRTTLGPSGGSAVTPAPTSGAVQASAPASEMSPLDE